MLGWNNGVSRQVGYRDMLAGEERELLGLLCACKAASFGI
jgi:hypothetical protein